MRYEKFTKIEDSSRLAAFFNSIMHRLFKMRMLCAPISKTRNSATSADTRLGCTRSFPSSDIGRR